VYVAETDPFVDVEIDIELWGRLSFEPEQRVPLFEIHGRTIVKSGDHCREKASRMWRPLSGGSIDVRGGHVPSREQFDLDHEHQSSPRSAPEAASSRLFAMR
jgi:hypothetical protein